MSVSPIFILGAPRSGTTLLSLMLDSHSRIAIPYESHFIVSYFRRFVESGNAWNPADRKSVVESILREPYVRKWDRPVCINDIRLEACDTLAGTIDQIFGAYAGHCGKDRWGDKTPGYTGHAHVLNSLFPNCQFIHLIRDGRDVAISHARQPWGPADWPTALVSWVAVVGCARKMLAMLPPTRRYEIRFEELVENPDRELRVLMEFLGMAYEESMVSAYTSRASNKVGARIENQHANLAKPPSTSERGKWKEQLSRSDQALAYEIAGPLLDELKYPPGTIAHPLRPWRKLQFQVRRTMSRRFRRLFLSQHPKSRHQE
jgi:Sulfotransferase family